MIQMLNKFNLPNKSLKILVILVCADLFFILLHITHKLARIFNVFTTIQYNNAFNIYYDLTLAESFQYVKEYWIILFFAWLIFRKKQFFYTGWIFLFAYLLFDDMLSFHEGLGTFVIEKLGIPPFHVIFGELRYQDFGELSVSLFFGIFFLSMVAFSYFRNGKEVRTTFHYLIGGLFIIVFFGVIHDFTNRIFTEETQKLLYEITRLLEDGGEMVGMSLICWYVYSLTEPEQTSAQSFST